MRADRLLSLVLLLRRRGRMSATELARELEVSTRTVLRDVEALSTAGVPVYAERGRAGGFALLPGYTTDLTGLTLAEARALLVAGSRVGGAAEPELASAMRKVVAALPGTFRDDAAAAADRVLLRRDRMLAPAVAAEPEDPATLRTVREAVFAGRRLRLRYTARGEEPRWRTVDPVGLVEAGGRWYLLALRDGDERTYRISRVVDVRQLDEPARRGPVDLAALWEERRDRFRAGLPRCPARVRVVAGRRDALVAAALAVTGGSGDVLDVEFGGAGHAASVVWSLCPDVEVLAPPELRAAVAARAAATARVHERTPGAGPAHGP